MSAYLDADEKNLEGSFVIDDKKDAGWTQEIEPATDAEGELGRGHHKQTIRTFKPR